MISQKMFFENTDLEPVQIDGAELYKGKSGAYYRVSVDLPFAAIEYAENEKEARHGIFDDVDLFDLPEGISDEEIVKMMKPFVVKYCD